MESWQGKWTSSSYLLHSYSHAKQDKVSAAAATMKTYRCDTLRVI
jgi:hypothetical protein